MKKSLLAFVILLSTFSLVACSTNKDNSKKVDTEPKTTKAAADVEKEMKDLFEDLHPEYETFEWINTTQWSEEQEIKVIGTFIKAETEGDIVYNELMMDSGETFYALIDKSEFDEVPIKMNQKVILAGIAFGNNKNDDEVEYDTMYVSYYLPFNE